MSTRTFRGGIPLLRGVAAVVVALGLAYLAILAAFALTASPRPPALGWIGFGIVALVVVTVTWTVGGWLARGNRDSR